MELKFLTPTEVWEGYDPSGAPLENSIISSETTDNLVCSRQYFTAEETAQGRVRAYLETYSDVSWDEPHATLLMLVSYPKKDYGEMVRAIVSAGFTVCLLDYCGAVFDGEHKTTFPSDLSFASYPECGNYLDQIQDSARNTPWFVWSKLTRRAITLLATQRVVDKERIGILGIAVGAHVAWQVAAMDKRVRALVSVGGGVYRWAICKPRFSVGNVPSTDEDRTFSAGVGAETYAKFVACPTLLITSRTAHKSDVDRASDILSFVKSEHKQLLITTTNETQLSRSALNALTIWLEERLMTESQSETPSPSAAFETIDGNLYLRLHTVHKATNHEVCVCYGEPLASARHWTTLENLQKLDLHYYSVGVPIYNIDELIVAFATFTYPDGNMISTPVTGIIPSKQGITATNAARISSRVVYDGSMGTGAFVCLTDDAVIEDGLVRQKKGPFDIMGVTSEKGGLYLCRSAAELASMSKFSTLHFDAYSPEPTDLCIDMFTYPDFKRYSAYTSLKGGEFWQKILLQNADFKSEEGKTLVKFDNMKVLAVRDTQGVIFNNFMWI